MTINFIPNDPRAGTAAPAMRQAAKRATRPASRSGFTYSGTQPEGVAAPGTPQFLFWQTREAGIAALEAWEAATGKPHTAWQGKRKKIALYQDKGQDLNAYYDRASFSFFHQTVKGVTYYSGASTDVVAHETGHGLLDSVRPEFFTVNLLEVAALHEAFGDCIALLTALGDTETRQKLLAAAPDLRQRNFVESTAEELSYAIGQLVPGHNAAEPRHACNTFQYQIPSTLPTKGGPGALINEAHSFGMIFTGCFWDLIANFYASGTGPGAPATGEAALAAAARLAGELLIAGVSTAVVQSRMLQSVGQAMALADQNRYAGAHRPQISDAFARHGIQLGANAVLAPSAVLEGAAPKGMALSAATRRDLRARLGDHPGASLRLEAADLGGTAAVTAVHTRAVDLEDLDPRLAGAVAMADESVVVGSSGARAAVLGMLPHPTDTENEVKAYVASLLAHDRIDFGRQPAAAMAAAPSGRRPARQPFDPVTHRLRRSGNRRILERVRFLCGPGAW